MNDSLRASRGLSSPQFLIEDLLAGNQDGKPVLELGNLLAADLIGRGHRDPLPPRQERFRFGPFQPGMLDALRSPLGRRQVQVEPRPYVFLQAREGPRRRPTDSDKLRKHLPVPTPDFNSSTVLLLDDLLL